MANKLIIAVSGGKGGGGKSTTSRAIGAYLAARRITTTGIDFDSRQQTFTRWHSRREDAGRYPMFPVMLAHQLVDLRRKVKDAEGTVIIDCGSYFSADTVELAALSDFMILPCKLSFDDVDTMLDVLEGLEAAKVPKEKIIVCFVACSDSPEDEADARELLASLGIYAAPGRILFMKSHGKIMDKGGAVVENGHKTLGGGAQQVVKGILDRIEAVRGVTEK